MNRQNICVNGMSVRLPALRELDRRLLTSAEFSRLQEAPPEAEWFANLESPGTRRIYRVDIRDLMRFFWIQCTDRISHHHRSPRHRLSRRLARRKLQGATIRGKLAALSSLYEYLCDKNAVPMNPVKGVRRLKIESYEGKTGAPPHAQARMLLDAPQGRASRHCASGT